MKMKSIFVLISTLVVLCVLSSGCLGLIFPDTTPKTVVKYDNVIPTVEPLPTVTLVPIRTVEMPQPAVWKEPQYTVVPTIKVTPKPTIITSTGNSGWEPYYNYNDGIKVYKPKNWVVRTMKSDDIIKNNPNLKEELKGTTILEDAIYIINPSNTGFVMLYGVDYRGTLSEIFLRDNNIDENMYQSLIDGLTSDESSSISTISNIQRDENYYVINGINARRVSFDLVYKSAPSDKLKSDAFLFMKDGKAYMTWYISMKQSSASDLQTAGTIMRSFTVI